MSPAFQHELATQAQSLRSLARALVGEDGAGDLVQQTALHALRASRVPSVPQGWLRTTMHRLAGKHWRGLRRRLDGEARMVGGHVDREDGQTPLESAAQRETLLRLTGALVALSEPYRGTLMARYFEDLLPNAIAARDGVPVATVKARLQRGLAQLRERLERDGTGSDWRAALIGTFGLRDLTPATPAVVAAGVFVMGTGVKLALGGLAAALCVAAGLWWAGGGGPPTLPVVTAPEPDATAAVAPTESLRTERHGVEPAAVPTSETAPSFALVRGRCVDTNGDPLAGCVVRVRAVPGGIGRERRWQERHGAFEWDEPTAIATGADGAFRIEVPPTGPRLAELEVAAQGRIAPAWQWDRLLGGDVHDVGDVVVRRLVQTELQVQNRLAQPLPWFSLRFRLEGGGRDAAVRRLERVTHTDADGKAIVILAEGDQSAEVMCVRPDQAESSFIPLRVPGDQPVYAATLTIDALPNVASITGLVLDGTGSPVHGARIQTTMAEPTRETRWTPFDTATDAEGRFVLARPAVETWSGDLLLHVGAEGYDRTDPVLARWGQRDVQVALAPAIAVEFVVHDPSGVPVTEYDLTLELVSRPGARRWEERFEQRPHPDGVVVCDGLPRGNYELTIEPRSPTLCARYAMPLVIDGRGSGVVEVDLEAAAARPLRVQDESAEPVAGATFERLANRRRGEDAAPDTLSRALTFQESRRSAGSNQVLCFQRGKTDAEGAAVLLGPAGEPFAVRVSGAGNLPVVVTDVDLGDRAPLTIVMQRGATLRGRVGPAPFVAWVAEFVEGREEIAWLAVSLRRVGSPDRARAILARDGTFVAESLAAGTWKVSLRAESGNDSWIGWDLGTVPVVAGSAETREFDLATAVPVRLLGKLAIDGMPATGGLVITDEAKTQQVRGSFGNGAFFAWVRPGVLRMDYWKDRDLRLCVTDRYEVPPGVDARPTFAIATGELRLRLVEDAAVGVPNVRVRWREDATSRSGRAISDTDGSVTRRIEAGTFRVQCLPLSLQGDTALSAFQRDHRDDPDALERRWLDLGVVDVQPGDERTRTIVLPPGYGR